MSCVAVAPSPVLAACQSPSMRHIDDIYETPSSPLLYAGSKLTPLLSSRKGSPSRSPLPPRSPRVQCSPRNPSWTSPIGTPSTPRSACPCSIYSSCSCSVASSSPSDLKWREKRFNWEALSDGKYGLSMESPSPRLNSSPSSRFSRVIPPALLVPEAPSPRYGGLEHSFKSPGAFSRPSADRSSPHPTVLLDECEPRLGSNRSTDGPSFAVSRNASTSEELFPPRLHLDRADPSLETQPASASASVSNTDVVKADLPGLSGRPVTPPLKRKRPPKLDIPNSMSPIVPSSFHTVDLAEEAINEMTVDGTYYGISCKKGRREILEDTHRAVPDLNGDCRQAFFGVFDGHGGRKAADFAAEKMVNKIMDAMATSQGERSLEEVVRAAYLATDAEFLKQRASSGACCVTVMMKDGQMVVANAGDCRAVLSRAGTAEALTTDHRAGREDERKRIESLGGFVDNLTGTWRVQGTLAVSRGIGDRHLKEWITAEPDIQTVEITSDCEFLILASDGLWDAVPNQEAVDTTKALLQQERLKAEVSDQHISLAMASSSLSKASEAGVVGPESQLERVHDGDEKNPGKCQETQQESSSHSDRHVSAAEDDEVDISVGTMDTDSPNVGFPEPSLPSAGPAAACKKLVEMSARRGSHDDISVLIVDLRHFQGKMGLASLESS